jgi:hypothetical protein
MSEQFEPWLTYPSFAKERLCIVAGIIRDARHSAVLLHDIANGDDDWSLGCRVYARTCHFLRVAALKYSWLRILKEYEKPLRFVFAIGSIPVRFYRGLPDDPPDRYLFVSDAERSQGQLALKLDEIKSLNRLFRLAVGTDSTREASKIILAEITKQTGATTHWYSIPLDVAVEKVVTLQSQPINIAPPTVEPVSPQGTAKEEKEKSGNQNKERDAI